MKHISLIAAGLIALAPAAWADTTFLPAQTDAEYLAKDHLIGAKVHGKEGTIVGDVEDLIINDQNQVVGVVMGTGGYLGWAEKKVGVDLASLKFEEKDGALFVSLPDLTKETIDSAPDFQRKKPAKSLFERAKEKVNEFSDKSKPQIDEAKKKAQEALDAAKEAAGPALEKAKEAVSGAIDTAKEAVGSKPEATPATPPADPAAPAPANP
ncbi:PRC-barrel domain-containing protein [Hyphomicrobium sp. LHD-15]|uniref:PRC-barrel domain-containing protein n=1 Tax=Hyphomicrobium sp. LHD-15 TaxID=3072142 RepID=UPI00280E3D6B|nr:PRC-barrel domain-containing protein [Hyphomicrobium sp. LHD-15]MDQ8700564.1 PRC-barrel domain-containing protein [Hyphomicrobium sp. LHD-15]